MKPVQPEIKIGYRVGMLTVESKTDERKNGYTIWLCKCDCVGEPALSAVRQELPSAVKECKAYEQV